MRIGLDGYPVVSDKGAAGAYGRTIIEQFSLEYPGNRLLVYTPKLFKASYLNDILHLHNVEFRLPAPSGFTGSLWRTFGITNCLGVDKIDIYHGLSNELPLNIAAGHLPTVVTIHEVVTHSGNSRYSYLIRRIREYKSLNSCRNATRIIAMSEEIKKEIMECYGISGDKIDVGACNGGAELAIATMAVYNKAIEDFHRDRPQNNL